MKFDSNTRNGKLRNRGRYGYEPGQFDTPHSRSLAARSNLYVAGLAHKRVQIFDNDGTFKAQILNTEPAPMDHEEIYKLELDGKILGKSAGPASSSRNSSRSMRWIAAPRTSSPWAS